MGGCSNGLGGDVPSVDLTEFFKEWEEKLKKEKEEKQNENVLHERPALFPQ